MIMMDRQKLKNAAGVGGGGPIIGGPLTSNLVMPFESQSPYIPQSLYAQALQRPNTSMNTHSSRFYQSSRKNSSNTIMSRRGSNNPRSDLKLLLQQDPNLVILNDSKLQAQQHLYRPLRQSYLEAQGQSLAIKKFIVNSSTKRANTSLNHSKTRLQTEASAQNALKQIQNSPSPFRQKNSQAIVAQNNSNTYFQPNTANLNQQNQFTSYGSRANSPAPMQRSKYYNYLNQKSNGNNTSNNNNNYTQKSIGISQEMEVNLQNSNNNSGYPSRYYNNIISTGVSPERIVNHVQQLYSRPRSSSNTKHSLYPHRTQASSPNNNDLRSVPLGHYHHQQVFKTENDQNPLNNSSGNAFTNQTQANNVMPPQNEVKVLREIDQIIKKIQKKNIVPSNQNTETLQSLNDGGEGNEANTDKYQEEDENVTKNNQQTAAQNENQNNPELDDNKPKSAIENQIPVVQLKSYQSSNPQYTQPPRSHTPESMSNSNGQTVNSRQNQRGLKDISNKIQQANYKIRNNNFFNNNQMAEGDLELSTNFQKQQIYRNNNIILQQLQNSQNYQQIPTLSNQKVLSEETQYLHKQYLFYQQQQQILKQQQIQQNMLAQHNNIVQQPQFYSKRNSNSSVQEKQLQLQIQQQQLQQQQYQISLQQQSSFLGLNSGSVTLDTFEMGAKIGTGSYAVVNLAIDKRSNQKVAIKVYEKEKLQDPHKMKNVKREVQILTHISHFNIIKLYYVIDAPTTLNLVMEYIGTSSLYSYLKAKPNRRLPENDARKIFRQVVEGIKYLHSRNIIHRDIKLENLLIDDYKNVKIIDFGFAVCAPKDKKLTSFCGTPSYMAPEIVSKKDYYGAPVDVWTCGVLLFVLFCGAFPFKGNDEKDLYKKIQKCQLEVPPHVPPGAKLLIQRILKPVPKERPDVEEILKDPWVQYGGSTSSSSNTKETLPTSYSTKN
ncbi:hypothetical protein ABPG72_003098 [Tetrahymena utriculariae]